MNGIVPIPGDLFTWVIAHCMMGNCPLSCDSMLATELLSRIETYCRDAGESETAFGLRAVNDGKLLADIRTGRSITLKTLEKIEAAMKQARAA